MSFLKLKSILPAAISLGKGMVKNGTTELSSKICHGAFCLCACLLYFAEKVVP